MAASIFLLTFPYGAMVALVLDYAPDNLQATAISFTMFVANVLIIGTGTFAIGYLADLLDARGISSPLTNSLLVADVIALSAAWLYLKLHWKTRKVPCL